MPPSKYIFHQYLVTAAAAAAAAVLVIGWMTVITN